MLTATVFLPLAGALFIAAFLSKARVVRTFAAAVAVADFALAVAVFASYDRGQGGLQLVQRYANWIPALNVEYFLAVDGISAPLVLLTGLLGLAAVFSSWSIEHRSKEYFVWLLTLQTAVMGVFVALDFILFFVFWELELIPMYLLISIWGSGRKEYSAMKFLAFTFLGSAFMLVAILVVYFSTGTFNMAQLAGLEAGKVGLDPAVLRLSAQLVFAFFLVAFAIKLPLWPLHTWLPDAHTDAPTAVSVMLAGVLLKMGGYGLIRINAAMFPGIMRDAGPVLAALAVVSILYGAFVVTRQTDLKRLIAYSSVSHMGYVLLGLTSLAAAAPAITPVGATGAVLQMFTHGTITGLLFVMVGLVYERSHTRHIPDLGGLASRMPYISTIFVVAALAALGLPALSGFVAELLVFLGTFPVWGLATALGAFGVVLSAGYMLWMVQRALFGPAKERWAHLRDATPVEAVAPALLAIAVVVVGIYPAVLTDMLRTGVQELVNLRFL
ncbi:MAG: NADH-quinone oxidoreductase subunit M [Chloroflexi bacterium]|nr:NADH-quinone oxidoreductase subunit M [Chloroflexota bacterium]